MKRLFIIFILLCSITGGYSLFSKIEKEKPSITVCIAAATNLKPVLEELKNLYNQKHPEIHAEIIYGASGSLIQQIMQGGPFDIFMSADTEYPEKLRQTGNTNDSVTVYAYGRLVLWSSSFDVSLGPEMLLQPKIKKIAIARPEGAPYGKATITLLKNLNLYEKTIKKIVWGDNISQTAQFAFSGNAEAGFIALSLALAPEMKSKGNYYLFSDSVCPPVAQGAVLLKNTPETRQFLSFITNKDHRNFWEKYGYKTTD